MWCFFCGLQLQNKFRPAFFWRVLTSVCGTLHVAAFKPKKATYSMKFTRNVREEGFVAQKNVVGNQANKWPDTCRLASFFSPQGYVHSTNNVKRQRLSHLFDDGLRLWAASFAASGPSIIAPRKLAVQESETCSTSVELILRDRSRHKSSRDRDDAINCLLLGLPSYWDVRDVDMSKRNAVYMFLCTVWEALWSELEFLDLKQNEIMFLWKKDNARLEI